MIATVGHTSWRGSLFVLTLVLAAASEAVVAPDAGGRPKRDRPRVARRIEQPPLAFGNPRGLAFSPRAHSFLVAPAEGPAALQFLTHMAESAGAATLDLAGADALNMAFDGRRGRLLALRRQGLVASDADAAGRPGRRAVAQLDAAHLGILSPAGMTVDPRTGILFVLDGAIPRLVEVLPAADGALAAAAVSYRELHGVPAAGLRGLAFDPVTGHLFMLGGTRTLFETSATGELLRTHDVSEAGLRSPGGMVFAPTGDQTDDPSALSLYVADAGPAVPRAGSEPSSAGGAAAETSGAIVELTFAPIAAITAATTFQSSVVATTLTSQWSPPAPDPSDVVYLPASNTLLVVDSEVEEMSIWAGANQWETTLAGSVLDTTDLTPPSGFTSEPTGISVNPANGHLFYSDDSPKKVFEIDPGPDQLYHTSDDVRTSFSTTAFGSSDPEDVTFHPWEGVLYLADGVNAEVYRIAPGANGVFDGVPPAGDDVLTQFDVSTIVTDPECLTVDTDNGHLYIAGRPDTIVQEITTSGTLLQTIDIAAANPNKTAGIGYGPGSTDSAARRLYVVQRGVDNNSNPNENDGKLWEMTLPGGAGGNQPPLVSAGADQTIALPASASLDGTVADDGLPNPPGLVTAVWSRVSGPGTVTFADPAAVDTTASFSAAGTHVLRLTADDSALISSDDTTITVLPEGTFELRVAFGADDAEERVNGTVSLVNNDLELVNNSEGGVTGDQTVGLRFRGVPVAPGATITNAWIQFQADESHSGPTNLTIRGEASDDAPAFVKASGNLSSRPTTAASAAWSPGAWTTGAAGAAQRTGNIAAVIQEIVSRPGWASGNSLVLLITGTGKRVAEPFEGTSSGAPLLHVELTGGAPLNQPPSVSAGPDQTVTPPGPATLDGTVSDDGLPSGTLSTTWSQVGGPGTASFADASAVDTTATFSAEGSYVLRLTASDGALSASDDVTVTVGGGGTSPLSVVKRATIHSATDAASYAFPSFTASNDRLYVVFLNTAAGSGFTAPAATSVSGAGLGFTEIGAPGGLLYSSSPGVRRIQAFRALSSAGATTGSIAITLNGASLGMDAVLLEFSGVDTSGANGSGAIAQSATSQAISVTSLSVSLAAFSSPDNRPVAFFSHRAAEATAEEPGYTELDDASHSGPVTGAQCEWNSGTAETTPSASWATAVHAGGFALEIRASGGP
jgi:hypothetical protein